ncbi:hypothetical protein HY732_03585, partial [Candidatus Uhrbacteria bacterium]|nr:hypothetical protein [Candidatus Uhrbacteria bacterium]
MKKRSLIVSIVSFTAFVFYLGFFSTDNVVSAEHPSIVPSPIIASQYTDVITIKGNGWGLYTERRDATVLLILVDDANTEIPLTVDQNYMSALDLLLRVNLPQNLAEGDYALSVSAQGGTREATAPFRFVRLPDFRNSNRPIMAVNPTAGPVGAHVFLTVGGFPEKSGLILRFGGQKLSTGLLMTDENGAVGQHAFTIPATITKDFKVSAVTPGKYTIEVSDGRGLFQTVTFTVTDKDKEEEPKKEEPKKEEPKKEEPKKEEPKKEEPKKEEPKKEEP